MSRLGVWTTDRRAPFDATRPAAKPHAEEEDE